MQTQSRVSKNRNAVLSLMLSKHLYGPSKLASSLYFRSMMVCSLPTLLCSCANVLVTHISEIPQLIAVLADSLIIY